MFRSVLLLAYNQCRTLVPCFITGLVVSQSLPNLILRPCLTTQHLRSFFFFFFNDPAPPEISPLPLHDALPIFGFRRSPATALSADVEHILNLACVAISAEQVGAAQRAFDLTLAYAKQRVQFGRPRSEEHTSELQSPCNLVCRLLLEKKQELHHT